ncbi:hypothetical protein BD410DRAFT_793333 [Rickenella mellea]|uniref:NAD(P)-binding domain-containing protein n=1 Tax=Rickenella mellea TaxID=50990 RepID=A0A4Y7PV75_9AGAM|nr:hypothetical protein BD410DRAFT_793333 [Rickenella mellea]
MNVLLIGGSKNVGYYAAQRLLANNSTVTFLLRNKSSFENDEIMKPYIASRKARIVEGDALKEADVQRAWDAAASAKDGHVDLMLFTVGGTGTFSLTKGLVLDTADLCTRCMLNVLRTMPRTSPQPKIILVSAAGLTKSSHASLPLALKPMYSYLIASPHLDKLGMERAIAHSAGWKWEEGEPEPKANILPDGWRDRLPEPGTLKSVLVLRPAMFTDGKCKADEIKANGGKNKGYRVSEQDLRSSYTISRRDVAHFIVEDAIAHWYNWEGKLIRMAY